MSGIVPLPCLMVKITQWCYPFCRTSPTMLRAASDYLKCSNLCVCAHERDFCALYIASYRSSTVLSDGWPKSLARDSMRCWFGKLQNQEKIFIFLNSTLKPSTFSLDSSIFPSPFLLIFTTSKLKDIKGLQEICLGRACALDMCYTTVPGYTIPD